jgi:hypothetical protein
MHGSGQFIESDALTLSADHDPDRHPTPQAIGSATTYARRYSLSAVLGMASEADDDGAAASGAPAETSRRQSLPPCPACSKTDSVIVGKAEYGGGMVCFAKKGGCGHKWQPQTEADKAAKSETERLLAEGKLTTADKLLPKNQAVQAAIESWAQYIVQVTPNSYDSDLAAIQESVKAGKLKPPMVEPIMRRAAELAETAGNFDMIDRLLVPMRKAAGATDDHWTKLALEIDTIRDAKLAVSA